MAEANGGMPRGASPGAEVRRTVPEPSYRVAAVENAVSLLNAFSDRRPRLTLRQLAERTGFSVSTAYRMTASLIHLGLLVRSEDGIYRLGPALMRLGKIYELSFDLAEVVRPVLAQIVAQTGHTAVFYIRENDRRICLYRQNAPNGWVPDVIEGATLPLDRGAAGRVLLAFDGEPGAVYDEIRRVGYYIALGDRAPSAAGVAAPVFGHHGHLVGSLGISGLREALEPTIRTTIKDATLAAAADLSRTLSGRSPPPSPKPARRGRPPKNPAQ
jgi:DNA-binding IclR family transcriptional regulator